MGAGPAGLVYPARPIVELTLGRRPFAAGIRASVFLSWRAAPGQRLRADCQLWRLRSVRSRMPNGQAMRVASTEPAGIN